MPGPLIKEKTPKHKRGGRPTLRKKGDEGTRRFGHDVRVESYKKRTLELVAMGMTFPQIARVIAEEYQLETVPCTMTVCRWRKLAMEQMKDETEELARQARMDQFNLLQELKAKWAPIALADNLQIQRWKFQDGELQPFMDEKAIKEQLEATKQLVNVMNREAKLLGMDIEQIAKENGEGPQTPAELMQWMISSVSQAAKPVHGTVIEGEVVPQADKVLELSSGIEEIDGEGNAV